MNAKDVAHLKIVPIRAANDQRPMHLDRVPVFDTPEEKLVISFSGISRSEQRAALAGFPGGKRFVLADEAA